MSTTTQTAQADLRLAAAIRAATARGDATGLRTALLQTSPTRAEVDDALAAVWRDADDTLRASGLRDALDGLLLGTGLVEALLQTVETALQGGGSDVAANAALRVLREAGDDPLDAAGWRRVAAVVVALRHEAVPRLDAAVLLAERGPAGPTLALTAFRDGPEDASDRLAALAALGRFDDARVAGWLHGVVASGAATLEALQAVADVAARAHGAGDEAALEQVLATLLATLPVDEPGQPARGDGWARWLALDIFTRLVGSASLPVLEAVVAAGGQDDVDWFEPQVRARLASLRAAVETPSAPAVTPQVPPLPDLATRVLSRCPRVARRAAHLASEQLQASGADQPSAATREALATALQRRAQVELALTARGQLLGSFFDLEGLEPAELGPQWQPWAEVLSDDDRAALADAETAWIGRD